MIFLKSSQFRQGNILFCVRKREGGNGIAYESTGELRYNTMKGNEYFVCL